MYDAFIIVPLVKCLFYLLCLLLFIQKHRLYTGEDSYRAMKRIACNNSRWKVANQSKEWRL